MPIIPLTEEDKKTLYPNQRIVPLTNDELLQLQQPTETQKQAKLHQKITEFAEKPFKPLGQPITEAPQVMPTSPLNRPLTEEDFATMTAYPRLEERELPPSELEQPQIPTPEYIKSITPPLTEEELKAQQKIQEEQRINKEAWELVPRIARVGLTIGYAFNKMASKIFNAIPIPTFDVTQVSKKGLGAYGIGHLNDIFKGATEFSAELQKLPPPETEKIERTMQQKDPLAWNIGSIVGGIAPYGIMGKTITAPLMKDIQPAITNLIEKGWSMPQTRALSNFISSAITFNTVDIFNEISNQVDKGETNFGKLMGAIGRGTLFSGILTGAGVLTEQIAPKLYETVMSKLPKDYSAEGLPRFSDVTDEINNWKVNLPIKIAGYSIKPQNVYDAIFTTTEGITSATGFAFNDALLNKGQISPLDVALGAFFGIYGASKSRAMRSDLVRQAQYRMTDEMDKIYDIVNEPIRKSTLPIEQKKELADKINIEIETKFGERIKKINTILDRVNQQEFATQRDIDQVYNEMPKAKEIDAIYNTVSKVTGLVAKPEVTAPTEIPAEVTTPKPEILTPTTETKPTEPTKIEPNLTIRPEGEVKQEPTIQTAVETEMAKPLSITEQSVLLGKGFWREQIDVLSEKNPRGAREQIIAYQLNPELVEIDMKTGDIKTLQGVEVKKPPAVFSAMINMKEAQALKIKMRYGGKQFMEGKREGRAEAVKVLTEKHENIEDIRQKIFDYAKEQLPFSMRNRVLGAIKNAKYQGDLSRAFRLIDNVADKYENASLKGKILKRLSTIRNRVSFPIQYQNILKEVIEGRAGNLTFAKDFLQKEELKNPERFVPLMLLEDIKSITGKPLNTMTNAELKLLSNTLNFYDAIGRWKFKNRAEFWEAQKAYNLSQLDVTTVNPIARKTEKAPTFSITEAMSKPDYDPTLSTMDKLSNTFNKMRNLMIEKDLALTSTDVFFDWLGNQKEWGTYAGKPYVIFKQRFDTDFGGFLTETNNTQDKFDNIKNEFKLKFNNSTRLAKYFYYKQATEPLLSETQRADMKTRIEQSGVTLDELSKIVLTTGEQKQYDAWEKYRTETYPRIRKLGIDLYNIERRELPSYFPIVYDFGKKLKEVTDFIEVETINKLFGISMFGKEGFKSPYSTTRVQTDFLEPRKAPSGFPLLFDFDKIVSEHIQDVAYFLNTGKTIKMLAELANSKEFSSVAGDLGTKYTRDIIDLWARKGGVPGQRAIWGMRSLRRNIGNATLVGKLSSTILQFTSIIDAMGTIGNKWTAKGVAGYLTDRTLHDIVNKFPEMKNRNVDDPAYGDMMWGNRAVVWASKKGIAPLKYCDGVTAGCAMTGAYLKYINDKFEGIAYDKLTPEQNREAMLYAERTVRKSQATSSFKDVPLAISRGAFFGHRDIDKAAFQFMNFMLFRWNNIRHDAIRIGLTGEKNYSNLSKLFYFVILASTVEFGMRQGVNFALDKLFGIERPDKKRWLDKWYTKLGTTAIGNFPIAGTALNVALFDQEVAPMVSVLKEVGSSLGGIALSTTEQARQRAELRAIRAALVATGSPAAVQLGDFANRYLKHRQQQGKQYYYTPKTENFKLK